MNEELKRDIWLAQKAGLNFINLNKDLDYSTITWLESFGYEIKIETDKTYTIVWD